MTITLVFLKLFKNVQGDYKFQQRISLTTDEFENLTEKSQKIGKFTQSMTPNQRHTRLILLHLQKFKFMVTVLFAYALNAKY